MLKVTTGTFEITDDNPNEKKGLTKVFSRKFREIFKNIFSTEHLRMIASDIRVQIVVIYNSNLSLKFVTINFTVF